MKPKFSILTLLVITAYVAVNAAAFRSELMLYVAQCQWHAIVFALIVVAAGRTTPQTVFARGCLLTFLLTFGALIIEAFPVVTMLVVAITDSLKETGGPGPYQVTAASFSLVFGLLGGCIALWRFRVLERRATEKVQ